MDNFLNTEDQVRIREIVEKLIKQNSKRYTTDDDYVDIPCSTQDILANCPELSDIQAVPEFDSMVPQAGSPYIYRSGQLMSIGRRVARRMVDPSGQQAMLRNRHQLDERLQSVGIYHNRLAKPCGIDTPKPEEGGRGDPDPGKRNSSMG
ncbi:uncharacterized protein LOC108137104 isoform X1 [Drosophila elegans]|uniref:uncharacterized protein LOC108137104 isoform X1 n=1 Tax=Drosophila elegans TaxID=30023 RepID=UPI0007E69475|nr:uncharacterized protein LOC108137104 isoform X1 [Drosophila elegans]